MQTLIVKTDSIAHAKLLLSFFKTVRLVKSVVIEPVAATPNVVKEPAAAYNWTNPSRPATDEEIDWMLDECEKSTATYSSGEVINFVKEELTAWRKKKK